jgi:peptidyl-prolyl cis-trans isomerase A (cyclophilin A)
MRKTFAILFILMVTGGAFAQSSSTAQSKPAPKPGGAAKPAVHTATKPTAIINTTAGKMTCTLFPDKAPVGVENFIGLASGTKDWKNPVSGASKHGVPLYDGTIFHRVIPGFMIQGGDPTATGTGDPGYMFADEFDPSLNFDVPGRMAMANSGPGTNGSQFFITEVPTTHLDQRHTIFGQCGQPGISVVSSIAHVQRDADDKPLEPVTLNKVTIVRAGQPLPALPAAPAPAPAAPASAPAPPSVPNRN